MKLKHIALLATLVVAGQAFALTAYEKHMGCNHEAGDCANGGGSGEGGGSGGYSYSEAFVSSGRLFEVFQDSQNQDGFFVITTDLSTGEKAVTQGGPTGKKYKKIVGGIPLGMNVPTPKKLNYSHLQLAGDVNVMSMAEAKMKAAAAAKAKFEADLQAAKAANQNVAAADAAALKAPVGVAGSGKVGAAAPMAIVQPAGGMSVGASSPRSKP